MMFRLNYWLSAALIAFLAFTPPVMAKSESAVDKSYAPLAKETYLTEAEVAFIRPGLEVTILDVVIPSDLQPEVTFKVADSAGMPLDLDGIYTPGPISMTISMTYQPQGEEYKVTYTPFYDRGGVYAAQGEGVYLYKFGTVLPEDYDADATTTLVLVGRRELSEWGLGLVHDNAWLYFVPSGAPMTTPPRDIVTGETCNRCHGPEGVAMHLSHGGYWEDPVVCEQCHLEGFERNGMNLNFGPVIHGVHSGSPEYPASTHEFPADINDCQVCHTGGIPTATFPIVANPNPAPVCDGSGFSITDLEWAYAGGNTQIRVNSESGPLMAAGGASGSAATGKWVRDGTQFVLVQAGTGDVLQELTVDNTTFGCNTNAPGAFYGEAATNHTAWMTNPSREACGACHVDIDFATGEGHPQQNNDDMCSTCHIPDSGNEFDMSVKGAHTVVYKSDQLKGFLVTILDIQNTDPGDHVKVTFSMTTKSGRVDPAEINRLLFSINGPNMDFAYRVQEDGLAGLKKDGPNWTYSFLTPLPDDAMTSFTLGVEGRLNGEVNGDSERDPVQNYVEPFAVTDTSAVGRRMVVDDEKCESCHSNLSLHGSNRHNATEYCQTCHMPSATDAEVRPPEAGAPQSIDFRYMIHSIHAGAERAEGYTVYGYRSSFHDFSEVEFPGELAYCDSCHVDDSYTLPLPAGLEDVTTPQAYYTPMGPTAAACLACHADQGSAAHAYSNTNEVGESCSACHGRGATYAVEKVHAQ